MNKTSYRTLNLALRLSQSLPLLASLAAATALSAQAQTLHGAPGSNQVALAKAAEMPASDLAAWPKLNLPAPDPLLEARITEIMAGMSLAQKVGQMTQGEIKTVTPDDVRRFYLGSVLNGGGSWPDRNNKHGSAADWVKLAQAYHEASMSTDMPVKVPLVWGIDAIHGHSNVYRATLFPHNIGLGASRNPYLVQQIAEAMGRANRATGIAWIFGPTIAVVKDDRWGRTYESFSEDGKLVAEFASAYVKGLQGDFKQPGNVIATAKHFMGDGGTDQGKDRGVNVSSNQQMIAQHAQGYFSALGSGAQTVMASYNSWHDKAKNLNYGKMHGNASLIQDVLKQKMGFDGFVVTDWDAIAEVPGCKVDSCAQAVNAGIDMFMVPEAWKSFIANTVAQVERGEIPQSRIDDAVRRILRVKLRAGLFNQAPQDNVFAGKQEALQARELGRQAVRESLVLLKNNRATLPLAPNKKVLVVGKTADSIPNQTGGWSLTWQGTDNKNSDFPDADSILSGIREVVGAANLHYSLDAKDVNPADYDAIIAVIGETPYAEGFGDIGPAGTLRHTAAYPEDLAVLQRVAAKGKPVVTVFVAGRPLYVNDLLNLSDSFVAAWLPGTEGKGVADLLFADAAGKPRFDFKGKLSFSWPAKVCQTPLNLGDKHYQPLFAFGYGLTYQSQQQVGKLAQNESQLACGKTASYPIFSQADRASYPLYLEAAANSVEVGADLNRTIDLPGVSMQTSQINTQQDAKTLIWSGPAKVSARAVKIKHIPDYALKQGVLSFDVMVHQAPTAEVSLAMHCGKQCQGQVKLTEVMRRIAGKGKQAIKVPLACFSRQGVNLQKLEVPFELSSSGNFSLAFTNVQITGKAETDADTLACGDLQ